MDILILHGWGSCAKNWREVKEGLERAGCRVYLPDLPGFGENPALERPWSIDDYVDWLEKYCEKNNFSRFFLLGHSFGGALAVKFVLKYPEKITKLFLVSPALIRRKTLKKEILKRIAGVFSFMPLSLKKIIYSKVIKSDYPLQAGPMRETYLRVIGRDLSKELAGISVKTVLFWGEKDNVTPFKDGLLIEEKVFQLELEKLSNIRHNPQTENPALLVEKLLENL